MSHTVDARGLLCPLPVIRIQDQAKDLPPGAEVELIASDPGVIEDVPAWCRMHGHEVMQIDESRTEIRVLVRLCDDDS